MGSKKPFPHLCDVYSRDVFSLSTRKNIENLRQVSKHIAFSILNCSETRLPRMHFNSFHVTCEPDKLDSYSPISLPSDCCRELMEAANELVGEKICLRLDESKEICIVICTQKSTPRKGLYLRLGNLLDTVQPAFQLFHFLQHLHNSSFSSLECTTRDTGTPINPRLIPLLNKYRAKSGDEPYRLHTDTSGFYEFNSFRGNVLLPAEVLVPIRKVRAQAIKEGAFIRSTWIVQLINENIDDISQMLEAAVKSSGLYRAALVIAHNFGPLEADEVVKFFKKYTPRPGEQLVECALIELALPVTAWPSTFPLTREKLLRKARKWGRDTSREFYLGKQGMFAFKVKVEMGSEHNSFRVISLEFNLRRCQTGGR